MPMAFAALVLGIAEMAASFGRMQSAAHGVLGHAEPFCEAND
jgi:hypothetical protein